MLGLLHEEQGEHFHQELLTMEKWYQGKQKSSKLADDYWAFTSTSATTFLKSSECNFYFNTVTVSLITTNVISDSLKICGWQTLKWCSNSALNKQSMWSSHFVYKRYALFCHSEVSPIFQTVVFWVLMSCSPAGRYKHFEQTCCHYTQGQPVVTNPKDHTLSS